MLLALTALWVMAPGAQADTVKASASAEVVVKRGDRGSAVRQVQSKLGIPADGVFGPQTERAVRRFQRSEGLLVDGIVGPQTRSALGLEPFSSRARQAPLLRGGGRVPGILRAIAECESGGNPRAVSARRPVPRQVPVQPGDLGGTRRARRPRQGARVEAGSAGAEAVPPARQRALAELPLNQPFG